VTVAAKPENKMATRTGLETRILIEISEALRNQVLVSAGQIKMLRIKEQRPFIRTASEVEVHLILVTLWGRLEPYRPVMNPEEYTEDGVWLQECIPRSSMMLGWILDQNIVGQELSLLH